MLSCVRINIREIHHPTFSTIELEANKGVYKSLSPSKLSLPQSNLNFEPSVLDTLTAQLALINKQSDGSSGVECIKL